MDSLDTGYEICVLKGEDRGKTIPLRYREMHMGRKGTEEREPGWIHFAEPTVSRHHATLVWDETRRHYVLYHKSRTNPSLVNGKRVQFCPLAHDDVVQVGLCVFKIIYVGLDPVMPGSGTRATGAAPPGRDTRYPVDEQDEEEAEGDDVVHSGLKLVVTEGPDRGATWLLDKTVMFVGRRESLADARGQNGVLLNDSALPKEQVLLAWNERERTYGIYQIESSLEVTEVHRLIDGRHQVLSLEGGMQTNLQADDLIRMGSTTLCVAYEFQNVEVGGAAAPPVPRDEPGEGDGIETEELDQRPRPRPAPGMAGSGPLTVPAPRSAAPPPSLLEPRSVSATQRLGREESEFLRARAREVQQAASALRSVQGRSLAGGGGRSVPAGEAYGGDEDEHEMADTRRGSRGRPVPSPQGPPTPAPPSPPVAKGPSPPQALRRGGGGEPPRISQLLKGGEARGGPERSEAPIAPPVGGSDTWPPMPRIGPASLTELSQQLGEISYPPLDTGFSKGGVPLGPVPPVPMPDPRAPQAPRPPQARPAPREPGSDAESRPRPPGPPRGVQSRFPAPEAPRVPSLESRPRGPEEPLPGGPPPPRATAGPPPGRPPVPPTVPSSGARPAPGGSMMPSLGSRPAPPRPAGPGSDPQASPGLPREYRPPELFATEEDEDDLEPDFASGTFSWKYKADYIIGFLEGRNRGQKVELLTRELQDGRQISVGCHGERFNEIEIDDPGVANRQALITYNGGRFSLLNEGRDGSVYTNQIPVRQGEEMLLKTGDRIHLGESVLIFLERAVVQVLSKFEFVVLAGITEDRTKTFDLLREVVVIGRLKSCDIVLADPEVSRKHLAVTLRGGRFYLTHLSSSNPTFINGVSLPRGRDRVLNEGDKVQLSDHTTLLFRLRPIPAGRTPKGEEG